MDVFALSLLPKLDTILNILYVALGLGLVIFIHELGHFAVAKWCDVKVERFSIGFGPVIWKFVRGETEYALSAIPFGGYVKMLGQDDADPNQMADDRLAKDPRSYTSKSVPQRIAIISAGVINNMISAVAFFVIAFMLGVQYQPAVVGPVTPGMPGWVAGLRLGDTITRINNREDKHLRFIDIRQAVALSSADEPVEIEGIRDGKVFSTQVHPIIVGGNLFPQIFVEGEQGLTLPDPRDEEEKTRLTTPGLAASKAEPPFKPGDQIAEVDGEKVENYAQFQMALAARRGKTIEIGVRRKGEAANSTLTQISVGPNHFRTLDLRMAIGKIKSIQRGSPADNPNAPDSDKVKVGDTITHVKADEKLLAVGADIDPLQLPDFFAEHAGKPVTIKVKREASNGNPTSEEITLVPQSRPGWVERPTNAISDCPLSVPAIGIAFQVLHHVVDVKKGGAADKAGLQKDDNIQSIDFVWAEEGSPTDGFESKSLEIKFDEKNRNWPGAFWLMQQVPGRKAVLTVTALGADKPRTVEIMPTEDPDWYLPMRGIALTPLMKERKAENIGEAATLGFKNTRDSIVDMWLTIRGLTSGRVSPKALGGPLRIAGAAYYFTQQGIPDLILFLGMLSVSLAVLNFLPIPVLDGGHFVFLCWEGIRGKPPSEKVVVTATYFGLALVLSLMAWVMYNDISGLMGN